MRAAAVLQTGLRLIYPTTCLTCDALVDADHGLCGPCWRDTPFVSAPLCNGCGAPLTGDHTAAGELCDDCLRTERPWTAGRTAMLYGGNARRLVLALKHGDRMDIARPAATWMAAAARDIVQPHTLVTAVPLHWQRRIRRRYNQSVLLARGVAKALDLGLCPDLLIRPAATPGLEGMSPDDRVSALSRALTINDRTAELARHRPVLVVDDVMTSGATLAAATRALLAAGAAEVSVLTLARAVKDA